jgi:hypothetical protein
MPLRKPWRQMARSGRESSVAERLARLKRRLATAFHIDAAMVALSGADLVTLRELEMHFTGGRMRAMSEEELRCWLAGQHVARKRGKVLMSTGMVTSATVQRWALDTLQIWLPGYTDFDEELGAQFKVKWLGPHGRSGKVDRFEVSTMEGRDPRAFRLTVAVLEDDHPVLRPEQP